MSTLSDQLASLGIRPSEAPMMSPADEIVRICAGLQVSAHGRTSQPIEMADLDEGVDVFHALEQCMHRLGAALAHHGVKLADVTTKYKHAMPCKHHRVEVDEALALLRCVSCGAGVNPLWWMNSYAGEITKSEDWRQHLEHEKRRLALEVDKLKQDRQKAKQSVKRAKMTQAKQELRAEGSDYLIPPAPKRKRRDR